MIVDALENAMMDALLSRRDAVRRGSGRGRGREREKERAMRRRQHLQHLRAVHVWCELGLRRRHAEAN